MRQTATGRNRVARAVGVVVPAQTGMVTVLFPGVESGDSDSALVCAQPACRSRAARVEGLRGSGAGRPPGGCVGGGRYGSSRVGTACPAPGRLCGDGLLAVAAGDLDVARLGGFADRDGQGEHARGVVGRDLVGVEALAEEDLPV
jgi:hypothetical protein